MANYGKKQNAAVKPTGYKPTGITSSVAGTRKATGLTSSVSGSKKAHGLTSSGYGSDRKPHGITSAK